MLAVSPEENKHTFKGLGYIKDFDNMTFLFLVPLRNHGLKLFNNDVRWVSKQFKYYSEIISAGAQCCQQSSPHLCAVK